MSEVEAEAPQEPVKTFEVVVDPQSPQMPVIETPVEQRSIMVTEPQPDIVRMITLAELYAQHDGLQESLRSLEADIANAEKAVGQ